MSAAINLLAPTPYRLYTASQLADIQPADYVIKGLLPSYGVASIFGASMSGKSFLSFDMGASITLGKPWFGYRTKAKPVAYFGLEGQAGLSKRWAAYRARHGADAEAMMHFGVDPINLGELGSVESVIAGLDRMGFTGGVVIIDTLACAMPGLQENDTASMGQALSGARQIAEAFSALVILVHHTGKDATRGPRGSSALTANLDALIEVRREGKCHERIWSAFKVKDGIDDDGDVITSCVIEGMGEIQPAEKPLTGASSIALKALFSVTKHQATPADIVERFCLPSPHDLAKLSDWKAACISNGISVAKNNDGITKAFNRAKETLTNQGRVTISGEWVWLT